eukprot:superscaffoldBa00002363_g14027
MCRQSEFAALTKELNACREQLLEKEEEISELKAERNNTRVRERLRVSLERVSALEEELTAANQEIVALREQNAHIQRKVASGDGGEDILEGSEAQQKVHSKRLSNGSLESAHDASQVVELQDLLEKQNYELAQMKERMSSLSSRVSEVEQELETARKDLIKSEEMNNKYQRDIKEAMCQKEDMEERIVTLEKRYLSAQRESTSVHDINDKLENELANKEAFLRQMEEKNRQLQERLELAEQKLQQTMRKAETLPEVEAELAQRIAALTKAEERHGSIEERMRHLECQLEEKNQELLRARQREKMNEEHNKRLSDTVDRLLTESNERLQLHLKERMAALEEKNLLIQDSEGYRKQYEESIQEKTQLAEEIEKLRSELDQFRLRAGSLTEPTLSRSHLDTSAELRFSLGSLAETQSDHYRSAKVIRRPRRGRMGLRETKAKSLGEHEWRSQQLGVLGGHHFESDTEMSDIDDDDRETLFSSMDLLSPSGHSDAQTLAMMLQEQLDAINKEIRYLTHPAPSDLRKHRRKIAAVEEDGREDKATIKCETSPPPTPRTVRMTHTLPASSHNDARGIVASLEAEASALSSVASSQDSLHKQPKKKGIKSSIGRLFGKKEKGRLAHLAHRQVMVDPQATMMDADMAGQDMGVGKLGTQAEKDRRLKKKHELLEEARRKGLPFAQWDGPTVVAWLEPSGNVWVTHEEMETLAAPSKTTLAYGDMNHEWIGNEWLPSLGLPQYRSYFMECLVDARMLDHLTKKDLRVHLKMVDSFHRTSLQYGIMCLKKLNYDRKELERHVLVWSNERVIRWVQSIGLRDYANILLESGVHGALVALDDNFDYSSLALLLQIPNQNTQVLLFVICYYTVYCSYILLSNSDRNIARKVF